MDIVDQIKNQVSKNINTIKMMEEDAKKRKAEILRESQEKVRLALYRDLKEFADQITYEYLLSLVKTTTITQVRISIPGDLWNRTGRNPVDHIGASDPRTLRDYDREFRDKFWKNPDHAMGKKILELEGHGFKVKLDEDVRYRSTGPGEGDYTIDERGTYLIVDLNPEA